MLRWNFKRIVASEMNIKPVPLVSVLLPLVDGRLGVGHLLRHLLVALWVAPVAHLTVVGLSVGCCLAR